MFWTALVLRAVSAIPGLAGTGAETAVERLRRHKRHAAQWATRPAQAECLLDLGHPVVALGLGARHDSDEIRVNPVCNFVAAGFPGGVASRSAGRLLLQLLDSGGFFVALLNAWTAFGQNEIP